MISVKGDIAEQTCVPLYIFVRDTLCLEEQKPSTLFHAPHQLRYHRTRYSDFA